MKLEIKLKDPKYCDGCPCLINACCVYFRLIPNIQYEGDGSNVRFKGYVRRQKCIKENGL